MLDLLRIVITIVFSLWQVNKRVVLYWLVKHGNSNKSRKAEYTYCK